MDRRIFFLSILAGLVVAVISYVTRESILACRAKVGNEKKFQQIVHGLGLGATTKPTWCFINFDPRTDPRCPCIEWPVAGGYCYCPDHTGTVSYINGDMEMGVKIEIVRNR